MGIKKLLVRRDDEQILASSGCDLEAVGSDTDNYIFSKPTDKLNILGAYYESINSPRHLNSESRIKEIVNESIAPLRQNFNDFRANKESVIIFV